MRHSWGIPAGLTALIVMLGASLSSAAVTRQAGPASAIAATTMRPGGFSVNEVTLITGDRVRVTTGPGGRESAAVEARYARPGVFYSGRMVPGPGRARDLLVVPSDAAGLVGSGLLDVNLFDVSELIRDGYTDAASRALPLIFTYRGRGAPAFAPTWHGLGAVTRALPSIDGAAVSEQHAGAARFWASLTRAAAGGNGPLALAPQVAKVWLDRRVSAAGAAAPARPATTPQPAASAQSAVAAGLASRAGWGSASRFTGKGVLVADLDTGYDSANPDLRGVVTGTRDFTGSLHGIKDEVGHGTWTASIIAGSGAGSGGRYPGVAPGARLLIGKVLDDTSQGTESQVIAGMQWAAAQHAKVVNMSLGFFSQVICQDGTEPISQALNSLSVAHGTLFVAAAGNLGQAGPGTVTAPGTASDALTAGAVDARGTLAFFSSTGPRCGDDAVKPDVTARGVGVVGARAAGTALGQGDGIPGDGPVSTYYTRASGTSASAPYASGAAAVLAQEHPAWNGSQLKTALMNSAAPGSGTGVYGQGDGQVDLARAVAQTASATRSVSDLLRWPHTAPSAMTVIYHNDGTAAIPLSLGLAMAGPDGSPAPAGMFRLSAAQVTATAGGSAAVTVTVDPAAGPDGLYGGWLTATGPGGTVLRTALGVENQPQLETITFRGVDRNGRPAAGASILALVTSLATGKVTLATMPGSGGALTAAVPPGRYEFQATVDTAATGTRRPSTTLIDKPDVNITRDMTVIFDARRGLPVSAITDHRVGDPFIQAGIAETVAGNQNLFLVISQFNAVDVYAVPTPRVTGRPFEFLAQIELDNGPVGLNQLGHATLTYSLEFATSGRIPARLPFGAHDTSLAVLRQTFRQQGKRMTFVDETQLPEDQALNPFAGTEFFLPAAGPVTQFVSPGLWQTFPAYITGPRSNLSPAWAEQGPTVTYRAGRVYPDSWGSAALGVAGAMNRLGDVIALGVLPDSASAPQHFDADLTGGLRGTITLRHGATVIGTSSINSQPQFAVPAASARYTLSASMRRHVPWSTLGTAARASWTFSSGHVAGTNAAALPLWDIRISGAFDFLDRAPAGRPFWLIVTPDLVTGAPRARITSITIRASFDDGRTWHRLVLRGDGPGHWTTTVIAPRGAEFVSLSASLTDAAGNSTSQTVIRAYQL